MKLITNNKRGYILIEFILYIAAIAIILPTIIPIIMHPFKVIINAYTHQIKYNDHLFISHLLRHEMAKSNPSPKWENNQLHLVIFDYKKNHNTYISYYIDKNTLKRKNKSHIGSRGRVSILSKNYNFNEMSYTPIPPKLMIKTDFLPITLTQSTHNVYPPH